MKYNCDRCNELQENIDNQFTITIGLAKYIDELEEQRRTLKTQLAIECEEKHKLKNELINMETPKC